jgi:hypothetical protein
MRGVLEVISLEFACRIIGNGSGGVVRYVAVRAVIFGSDVRHKARRRI